MTRGICTAAAGLHRSCAAPAGGALSRGRGRLGAMHVLALLTLLPIAAVADPLTLPSGRMAEAIEYLDDADMQGPVLRARYHAKALNGLEDSDGVFADMTYLCEADALAIRSTRDPLPPRIIISLSSQPLEFGAIDAGVVQYFEAFRVDGTSCIWELF